MGSIIINPVFRAFDSSGAPLAGGKVYTYLAGTSTPANTYTDATLSTPNTNPVILDSQGVAPIFSDGSTVYKINLTDSNGVQQDGFPIDQWNPNIGATGAAGTFAMATAAGSADAITATYSPALTLANLTTCGFVATAANATTTPTFAPNGLTAHTITKKGGQPLAVGDIPGALACCILEYNSANTRWELLNPATSGAFGTEVTVGSSTTTDLGAQSSSVIAISGTTTITSFGSSAATTSPIYFVRFTGALTLTYNATSLILPGAANITTVAGDTAIFKYEGSGNWRCMNYSPTSVTGTGSVVLANSPTFSGTPKTSSLTFPSGGNTALNWYEEGTFTPTFFGVSTAGTPTYVVQTGRFTRIGRMVWVLVRLQISALGSMAGQLAIGGLPYTCNTENCALSCGELINAAASTYTLVPEVQGSSTQIYLFKQASTGTAAFSSTTDATATMRLYVAGFYYV